MIRTTYLQVETIKDYIASVDRTGTICGSHYLSHPQVIQGLAMLRELVITIGAGGLARILLQGFHLFKGVLRSLFARSKIVPRRDAGDLDPPDPLHFRNTVFPSILDSVRLSGR
ncbi:MAG: hypothetical protein J0M24_03565 [Verrucomicrobia bacterium]|nr:hypothetical protein [Verrucomicrobiota bacterium]